MRPATIKNAEIVAAQIEDEISAKPEGQFYHRIHLMLLMTRGMTCEAVASLYKWYQAFCPAVPKDLS